MTPYPHHIHLCGRARVLSHPLMVLSDDLFYPPSREITTNTPDNLGLTAIYCRGVIFYLDLIMLTISLLGAYIGLELGSCTLNPLHPRLGLYQGLSLYRMTCTKHTEVSYSIVFLFLFSFLRISFFVHQHHMAQVTIGLASYPNPGKSIEILLGFLLCIFHYPPDSFP